MNHFICQAYGDVRRLDLNVVAEQAFALAACYCSLAWPAAFDEC